MSDALTDIARDEKRARGYLDYLSKVVQYLKEPSEENLREIKAAACETDSVKRGYQSGQTNLSSKLDTRLRALKNGDETEWARLLWSIEPDAELYDKLVEISPFKGKVLLKVNYGNNFVHVGRNGLDELVEGANFKAGDCDDYILSVPKEMMKGIGVTWVRCGIRGQNTPRDKKGKPRENKK